MNDFILLLASELHYISYSAFLIGLISFFESRDLLNILINLEIMMVSISFYTLSTAVIFGDYLGQVYVLCFLAISAVETVVGLSIVVLLHRVQETLVLTERSLLKE